MTSPLDQKVLQFLVASNAEILTWLRANNRAGRKIDSGLVQEEALRLQSDCLPPDELYHPVAGQNHKEPPQYQGLPDEADSALATEVTSGKRKVPILKRSKRIVKGTTSQKKANNVYFGQFQCVSTKAGGAELYDDEDASEPPKAKKRTLIRGDATNEAFFVQPDKEDSLKDLSE